MTDIPGVDPFAPDDYLGDDVQCPCHCHNEPDHCAICTNDYADLCAADVR